MEIGKADAAAPLAEPRTELSVHTPGPWFVGFRDGSGAGWIVNSDDKVVVRGGENDWGVAMGFQEDADGRLIAEAPAMLALLQELIDIEGPQPGHIEWSRKVKATIAKATGSAA